MQRNAPCHICIAALLALAPAAVAQPPRTTPPPLGDFSKRSDWLADLQNHLDDVDLCLHHRAGISRISLVFDIQVTETDVTVTGVTGLGPRQNVITCQLHKAGGDVGFPNVAVIIDELHTIAAQGPYYASNLTDWPKLAGYKTFRVQNGLGLDQGFAFVPDPPAAPHP